MFRVNFNYQKGQSEPFEFVVDKYSHPIRYRGKKVVKMNGNYYTIKKWTWDFHPNLDNEVLLAPLTKKGKVETELRIGNK